MNVQLKDMFFFFYNCHIRADRKVPFLLKMSKVRQQSANSMHKMKTSKSLKESNSSPSLQSGFFETAPGSSILPQPPPLCFSRFLSFVMLLHIYTIAIVCFSLGMEQTCVVCNFNPTLHEHLLPTSAVLSLGTLCFEVAP